MSGAPFGGLLDSILGALGPSWAPRGTLGAHKSPNGRPEANFGFILESFWLHFGGQNSLKIRANFGLTFLWIFVVIWTRFWELFLDIFRRFF